MHALIAAYWIVALLALAMGLLLGWHTWEHRRFVRSRIAHPTRCRYAGRAAVVVASKGSDGDLRGNLSPLFRQTHGDYELIFAVESSDDPACQTIAALIDEFPDCPARLVTAGVSTCTGQKVHNLRAATRDLPPGIRIVAFIDADVRPSRHWLVRLTQRLHDCKASTGYRAFVRKRLTLTNCVLASMDAAVTSLMFPGVHRKVWGGSWAIRRDAFDQIKLREAWQGTLSDDLIAARVLAKHGMRVALEPACIMVSPLDMSWREGVAFVRRQFSMGRFYAQRLWLATLLLQCAMQAGWWGSVALAIYYAVVQPSHAWLPAIFAALIYGLHVTRATYRQDAADVYWPRRHGFRSAVRRFDVWFGPLAGLACAFGLLGSAWGRIIVWKDIAYEMRASGRVERILTTRCSDPGTPRKKDAPCVEQAFV